LAVVEVPGHEEAIRYFLPLTLAWEQEEERMRALQPAVVARVRQQANVGVLADAFADESFCHALVEWMGQSRVIDAGATSLRFGSTSAFAELSGHEVRTLPLHLPKAMSSNTTVALGQRFFLKAYRRLRPGTNPEL